MFRLVTAVLLTLAFASSPVVRAAPPDTAWVPVHLPGQSPCPGNAHEDPDAVWCFEGAGGDSTWPAGPGGGWRHWSRFDPPVPQASKWHVTQLHGGAAGGTYNAWAGCDAVEGSPGCEEAAFWINQGGYGNDWNHSLVLDCTGQDATSGGTIEFDLRYDAECIYDYLYLEYFENASGQWKTVTDSAGTAAVFNGVSGNAVTGCDNGSGGALDGNYFDTSGLDGGGQPFYGNSTWYVDVRFLLPAQSGDTRLRWRAESDPAWSDADGRGDTDGLAAVDNLTVTFAADGAQVTDDFETGDFAGVGATIGAATWTPGSLEGNTFDGWHLEFDPMYTGKGTTCAFDDSWMWAAKPEVGAIPGSANGFDFFLVSPSIDVAGWKAGIVRFDGYRCESIFKSPGNNDLPRINVRYYDNVLGWAPWADIAPVGGPCGFVDGETWRLDAFLGASVESLQVSWEFVDVSQPGDGTWGKHQGSQFTVDNVAFGELTPGTRFIARDIDRFQDTFSLSDPAHTPFLVNADQGDWVGAGGSRQFATVESLTVQVNDPDGITAANVVLWWRHDDGGAGFGAWQGKVMDLALQDPTGTPGEGTYRQIVGADDGGVEDLTAASDGRVWKAGTAVEYYVRVQNDLGGVATYPEDGDASPFEFSVLPGAGGAGLLLVNDSGETALDVESSGGFDPTGGTGSGQYEEPAYEESAALTRAALDALGLQYDSYDVLGAGTVQGEPRGAANSALGLGGYLTDGGAPAYTAILWLNGTRSFSTLTAETRTDLATYLDAGGKLLHAGDGVAFDLGMGGNAVDATFLATYLGTAFPSSADDATVERLLNVAGAGGSSFDGVVLGLYGECPNRRRFDRLTLATPAAGSANAVVMEYASADPGDDGRPAVIRNERTGSGGVAVLAAFDPDALLSVASRACFLEGILGAELGLGIPVPAECQNNGTPVPPVRTPIAFELAAPAPNPAAGAVEVRFSLPTRSAVTVTVYDVTGRRVRTLVDGVLPAQRHARVWDGRTEDGRPAVSGLYFVRLQAGELTQTRKAVLRR